MAHGLCFSVALFSGVFGSLIVLFFFTCRFDIFRISINEPRVGFNSKTTQSKCVLEARRMYNFADYVLRMLKHLPIYCIGITLQSLI